MIPLLKKNAQLGNHLGNVLTAISDRKIPVYSNGSLNLPGGFTVPIADYFEPDMVSATDYYPFGMVSRDISPSNSKYRFGFNGKENDNDVKGFANQQDYGMRIYDPRVGRFLSVDPLAREYPWNSVYAFAENEPISNIDLDGLEQKKSNVIYSYFDGFMFGAKESYENAKQTGATILTAETYKKAYGNVKDVVVEGVKDPNTLVTKYTTFMTKWSRSFTKKVTNAAKAPGMWVMTAHQRTGEENAFDLGHATWKGLEFYSLLKAPEIIEGTMGAGAVEANLYSWRAAAVRTGRNEAFFWSGRTEGIGGAERALEIAKSKGGTTLEGLIESKKIKMPQWDINNPEAVKAWEDISAEYAGQVSGTVRAVVGQELRPNNIWENIELKRLKSNPNVTEIIIIDPKTSKETTIFKR